MRGFLKKLLTGSLLVPTIVLCVVATLALTPLSSVVANRSQDLDQVSIASMENSTTGSTGNTGNTTLFPRFFPRDPRVPRGSNPYTHSQIDLTVKASFDGKTVLPEDAIELTLNRQPSPAEGRLAVLIGQTDLTELFVIEGNSLKYSPKAIPLPEGWRPACCGRLIYRN